MFLSVAAGISLLLGDSLRANPSGMTVHRGQATTTTAGNHLTVKVSDNAFLNWRTFNLAPGEKTTFLQPSAASIVWNRVTDPNPSRIFGSIHANGVVVLANQAGFFFGPGSVVKAAGFVATTAPITPDFSSSGPWDFAATPPMASIINYGHIEADAGGSVFLIAEKIVNEGIMMAPDGNIGLYAGKEVLVSSRPDGRGLSAKVLLPSGSVDNRGKLVADAGTVAIHAEVVNQGGVIQANSVREKNGIIELVASEQINLSSGSLMQANGDAGSSASAGGKIIVKSDGAFVDHAGSTIEVKGGHAGGKGGFAEISANRMDAIQTAVDGTAAAGFVGGHLLIDPLNIEIGNSGTGVVPPGGQVPANANPGSTLRLNVGNVTSGAGSSFRGLARITLQAQNDISILANTTWNLDVSTGQDTAGNLLTLQAGRDIRLANNSKIDGGVNWSLALYAGVRFDISPTTVASGIGSILMTGTAAIETGKGNVNLTAGNNINVASGFIRTIGGGSIRAEAKGGNVNAGSKGDGYEFFPTGKPYDISRNGLGGISTAAGGDVSIIAGKDITTFFPTSALINGGSGAFGIEPGNVSLVAGANVFGHYVVRNGVGTITAENAGIATKLLALSLVKGSWTVNATDIFLQEVRNPNGTFNDRFIFKGKLRFLFDYDPFATVRLLATDSVHLLGTGAPRTSTGRFAPVYAPRLTIRAGAGGIELGSDLRLFPSVQGDLDVVTTDGGFLRSLTGRLFELIVSDSDRRQYVDPTDFGLFDRGRTLHLGNADPINVEISGDLDRVIIGAPRKTELIVGKSMLNSSLFIQHTAAADRSKVEVAERIWNRNDYTFAVVTAPPNFAVLQRAIDPATGRPVPNLPFIVISGNRLGFRGRMTAAERDLLLNLKVARLDANGQEVRDAKGQLILVPAFFVDAATIRKLFAESQDVPPESNRGIQIAGPGKLDIKADRIDLGVSQGILSVGPRYNAALARLAATGADISVSVGTTPKPGDPAPPAPAVGDIRSGNLQMFASTIQSQFGGDVTVNALGNIDVGSQEIPGDDQFPRGIITSGPGKVTVLADGNIDVQGSRIATYGGGEILVRSRKGDVNAGSGGSGLSQVTRVVIDPSTKQVGYITATIPGSGITATTFPDFTGADGRTPVTTDKGLRYFRLPNGGISAGDIRVETPKGDIIANNGGIVQITLSGADRPDAEVCLIAGTGTKDPITGKYSKIVEVGNINAKGSGVIGRNVKLDATGKIDGIVFSEGDATFSANETINVTALAQGDVSATSTAGDVSGTIVGGGSISVAGNEITAALLSQNVATTGDSSSAQVGFAATQVAATTSAAAGAAAQDESAKATQVVGDAGESEEDELKKRGGKRPVVTKPASRVTIILPKKP